MHAEDARVQTKFVLIGDKVKVPSSPNLTWLRLVSIFCEVGIIASLGMVLASCGGAAKIGPRQLIAISVQPGSSQAVAPDGMVTFSASGIFDQAPTSQTNLLVQWASSDPGVATIDPNTGIATCLAVGAITMTASAAGSGGLVHGSGMLACQGSPPPPSMQGSWIFLFHSDADSNLALEASLSQTGNHVFADKTSALLFLTTSQSTMGIQLQHLGGKCDSGGVGDVTVDATNSNGFVYLTLSETGALGSAVTTASAFTNGVNISNGTYSTPAACGFLEDHGTVEGYKDSIAFGFDSYSGTFNGGADAIVAEFTSTANSFDLTMSGTDNGTSFVLIGSTVGLSLDLTGTIADRQVNWFGLYDPQYNFFYIYDKDSIYVGSLH